MEYIQLQSLGHVKNARKDLSDDQWGGVISEIHLASHLSPESLAGLETFSHVEILFFFHKVEKKDVIWQAEHPRENPDWPRVGIFAQRKKARPNPIGSTVAEVVTVKGSVLTVRGLDAIDGTPILDIKPYLSGFAPRSTVREPQWSHEIMADYWS